MLRILRRLPSSLSLSDALEEAHSLKKEEDAVKHRASVETYRQANLDKKRAWDRAYYARKKARAVPADKKMNQPDKNVVDD